MVSMDFLAASHALGVGAGDEDVAGRPRCRSSRRNRRWIFWMTLPPEPMTSRILSVSIFILIILGALGLTSARGAGMQGSMIWSRIAQRASRVMSRASLMISMGQAVVLQVHLDGGDAGLGAGHLEVHLAVEVLHALDVDEGVEAAVVVLDQAAGNAGHGGLDGHTGVHQSQSGAADGALRGGTVGGQHLRHHADGVGELLHGGEHGLQRTLGQSAVAVLAAVGGAGGPGLAGGVGRASCSGAYSASPPLPRWCPASGRRTECSGWRCSAPESGRG